MATRRKGKGKAKATRTKTHVTKAARRRKTAMGTKVRTSGKTPAKKGPVRRASSKKTSTTAKTSVEPPTSPPAQRVAAKPTPSPSAELAPPEERLGVVTRYYIYVTRGGDTREFFWEAKDEEEARLMVDLWNKTLSQSDEMYFVELYEGDR